MEMLNYACSGNGLISYYCNLVFESVGITETRTKAALNGGLQVCRIMVAKTTALIRLVDMESLLRDDRCISCREIG